MVDGYDPLMAEWLALSRNTGAGPSRWPSGGLTGTCGWRHWRGSTGLATFLSAPASGSGTGGWGCWRRRGVSTRRHLTADPSLRRLVDVVPYGLPEHPLPSAMPAIKGVWPGIELGDRLALWGGGLWPWLDPLTAIRAVALLRERRPRLKLVFPGTRHPNPTMARCPTR